MPLTIKDPFIDLAQPRTPEEKFFWLHTFPEVAAFLQSSSWLVSYMNTRPIEDRVVIASVIAIGQYSPVFDAQDKALHSLESLLRDLRKIEDFYQEIGGILGYQACVLKALNPIDTEKASYHIPQSIDVFEESSAVKRKIITGILSLPRIAQICPVGGAADRLGLFDEHRGHFLPAAKLFFMGKTLLERIVVDLQALEYLYYKVSGVQHTVPLVLMTSQEKDNHEHILSLCENKRWFLRPKESFFVFSQPSVPVVNRSGQWCMQAPFVLHTKPGGHGAIWKLARDYGVFAKLCALGKDKLVIRQINNPIACTDYGLLAFIGEGCMHNKAFGFLSCPRQEGLAEGVNVLAQDSKGYRLTNIEYCDTTLLKDKSFLPANTNILFADLHAVFSASLRMPFPGAILNFRGEHARLESMMQNIADSFIEEIPCEKTFLVQARRIKTISTTKRLSGEKQVVYESPERCMIDFMHNARELLEVCCRFSVAEESVFFTYHPALGPLYSIIAAKLRGGCIKKGSELQLHLAEVDIENLYLDGSLCISADNVMGCIDDAGIVQYGDLVGRCTLKDVRVCNQGAQVTAWHTLWNQEPKRFECCKIILKGMSEFYAENITLSGDLQIEVADGEKVTASLINGSLRLIREPISRPSWHWDYHIEDNQDIIIKKVAP